MTKLLHTTGPTAVWWTFTASSTPTTDEAYTWWSNRGQAWANNVGWRLDYHLASPTWPPRRARPRCTREQRFSDHAPLTIDYDFAL